MENLREARRGNKKRQKKASKPKDLHQRKQLPQGWGKEQNKE